MKHAMKALHKSGKCFLYLRSKFQNLSVKEGIFVRPQIRKLIFHENFEKKKKISTELAAWTSFKASFHGFLGNRKE
jgi:hypothetical protein